MNSNRPVNLDLTSIRLPLPAYASILHRISGIILFVGTGFALKALELSLASPAGFAKLQSCLQTPFAKIVLWALLSALGYHFFAGIKHLLMDSGIGESKEAGRILAQATLVLGLSFALLAGYWIW